MQQIADEEFPVHSAATEYQEVSDAQWYSSLVLNPLQKQCYVL